MEDPSSSLLWTLILVVTALLLALLVSAQILSTYTTAYLDAPREVAVFLDAVDFSIQENESYDRDVARVQRLDDKVRLDRLLREIQKGGDDLREDLNRLLIDEGSPSLRLSSRILWANHRKLLEERVRRLDLLRTRFLVVYMGIVATTVTDREKEKVSARATLPVIPPAPPFPDDDMVESRHRRAGHHPVLPSGLVDGLKKKKHNLARVKTTPMVHSQKPGTMQHRTGWMGVVEELQRSPVMAKRHASIEEAMSKAPRVPTGLRTPPSSPTSSPLAGGPIYKPPSPISPISEDLN